MHETEKHTFTSIRFTHIPRCGGTSLRSYLYRSAINSGIKKDDLYIPCFGGIPHDKNLSQLNEAEINDLKKAQKYVFAGHMKHNEYHKNKIDLGKPFNIVLLRNPTERFISHYNHFNFKLGLMDCKGISLNELPPDRRTWIINRISNLQARYIGDIDTKDVHHLTTLYDKSMEILQSCYHIIGFPNYVDQFIDQLNKKVPSWFKPATDYPKLNTTKYSSKINPDILDEIKEANYIDYALYKWALKINNLS